MRHFSDWQARSGPGDMKANIPSTRVGSAAFSRKLGKEKAGEVFRRQESMHEVGSPCFQFFSAIVTLTVSVKAGSGPSGDCR